MWKNPIIRCLYLSTMTFLFTFLCFGLYWEIRDFWQFRWYGKMVDHPNIIIEPIHISINLDNRKEKSNVFLKLKRKIKHQSYLYGEILHYNNTPKNAPIVIISHGFSDDAEYIRHYTIPIALASFDVISYDCRGTKRSSWVGNKNQFAQITQDLGDIINFTQNNVNLKDRPIYLVGFSFGAVSSIRQGLNYCNNCVEKIIAISAIGNYLNILPSSPIPFTKNWFIWFRYKMFNVPINSFPQINFQISPLLQFQKKKNKFNDEKKWVKFTNQIIQLVHAKNDKIISLSNFYDNLKITELTNKNWMLTKGGGHNFLMYEMAIVSLIISKLKRCRDFFTK